MYPICLGNVRMTKISKEYPVNFITFLISPGPRYRFFDTLLLRPQRNLVDHHSPSGVIFLFWLSVRDAKYKITRWTPVYFISLVATDAGDFRKGQYGAGHPRKALSFFDIFSEMEFDNVSGITFLSAQDLLKFYQDQTGQSGNNLNVYQLVVFFIKKNPYQW